jgi:hypothetical protein
LKEEGEKAVIIGFNADGSENAEVREKFNIKVCAVSGLASTSSCIRRDSPQSFTSSAARCATPLDHNY